MGILKLEPGIDNEDTPIQEVKSILAEHKDRYRKSDTINDDDKDKPSILNEAPVKNDDNKENTCASGDDLDKQDPQSLCPQDLEQFDEGRKFESSFCDDSTSDSSFHFAIDYNDDGDDDLTPSRSVCESRNLITPVPNHSGLKKRSCQQKKRRPRKSESPVCDRLIVSNEVIAKRRHGIVFFKATQEGRPVAVKRIALDRSDAATNEIKHLIALDNHPNVIRFYGSARDSKYMYLSLERFVCNLYHLVRKQTYRYLWRSDGYPSVELLNLMRGIVAGLAYVHHLNIIYMGLKPHNVLLVEQNGLSAKLSDMGNSKCLATDNASEQIPHEHQKLGMDMYDLGRVLFFCITCGGRSPFEYLNRFIDVAVDNKVDISLVNHIHEAFCLISQLLNPDLELRPKASEVLHHPMFWNSEKRMLFIRHVSDRVKFLGEKVASIVALENIGPVAFGEKWGYQIDRALTSYRKNTHTWYNYKKVRHLLRFIRNIYSHYLHLPNKLKNLLVSEPQGIDDYFRSRFPKLLMEVYNVMYTYYKQEDWFQTYLGT